MTIKVRIEIHNAEYDMTIASEHADNLSDGDDQNNYARLAELVMQSVDGLKDWLQGKPDDLCATFADHYDYDG